MKYLLLLCGIIFSISNVTQAAEVIHWGYDKEISPEHWAELDEHYKVCKTGKNQTPINIVNPYKSAIKHNLKIDYKATPHDIVFNGHTVQVNTKKDDHSDFIVVDQQKYYLKQFHFHTPSENQIQGKNFPLELHFVNENAAGELTVLAVMFNIGSMNTEWNKFWADLSFKENDDKNLSRTLNLNNLLPKKLEYYRFSGSLTTPPCSEGVNWIVLKHPLTISQQQLQSFKLLITNQDNHRPIQPLNGRIILED